MLLTKVINLPRLLNNPASIRPACTKLRTFATSTASSNLFSSNDLSKLNNRSNQLAQMKTPVMPKLIDMKNIAVVEPAIDLASIIPSKSRKRPIDFIVELHAEGFTLFAVGFKLKQSFKNSTCKLFDHESKTWMTGTWQHATTKCMKNKSLLHGVATHVKRKEQGDSFLEVFPEEDHSLSSLLNNLATKDISTSSTPNTHKKGIDPPLHAPNIMDPLMDTAMKLSSTNQSMQDANTVYFDDIKADLDRAKCHLKSCSTSDPNGPTFRPFMWSDGKKIRSAFRGDKPALNPFNTFTGTVNKTFRR